jgi:hypothetical protein
LIIILTGYGLHFVCQTNKIFHACAYKAAKLFSFDFQISRWFGKIDYFLTIFHETTRRTAYLGDDHDDNDDADDDDDDSLASFWLISGR